MQEIEPELTPAEVLQNMLDESKDVMKPGVAQIINDLIANKLTYVKVKGKRVLVPQEVPPTKQERQNLKRFEAAFTKAY